MNAEKSRNADCLLKTLMEDNIDEDNKNATINHPLYDDELKSTIKKNIRNTIVQQNDIKKEYNHESIEIEYVLCNASTMCLLCF